MIKSFKHKGLNRFFRADDPSLLDRKQCNRIGRLFVLKMVMVMM